MLRLPLKVFQHQPNRYALNHAATTDASPPSKKLPHVRFQGESAMPCISQMVTVRAKVGKTAIRSEQTLQTTATVTANAFARTIFSCLMIFHLSLGCVQAAKSLSAIDVSLHLPFLTDWDTVGASSLSFG